MFLTAGGFPGKSSARGPGPAQPQSPSALLQESSAAGCGDGRAGAHQGPALQAAVGGCVAFPVRGARPVLVDFLVPGQRGGVAALLLSGLGPHCGCSFSSPARHPELLHGDPKRDPCAVSCGRGAPGAGKNPGCWGGSRGGLRALLPARAPLARHRPGPAPPPAAAEGPGP